MVSRDISSILKAIRCFGYLVAIRSEFFKNEKFPHKVYLSKECHLFVLNINE